MKMIITAILVALSFGAAAEEMPKTSAEALARCEAMNARLSIVEDCTQTDFVYRTLKEREPERNPPARNSDIRNPQNRTNFSSAADFLEWCMAYSWKDEEKCKAAPIYLSLKEGEPKADSKRPTAVSDDMPKTSAEALAQCKAHNLRFGIVEDCTKTDFVYKTMKEVEAYRARQAKAEKAAKAKAARPGVRIGMTRDQVINGTNWGKPQKVNRTTTRYGTSEQWVYGDGNYLYFEDGVLTSIQN